MYKLSEYAKKHGICYRTAYDHFKRGLIPQAYQLPTGTIVIPEDYAAPKPKDYTIIYSRVSSSENKTNLDAQAERLLQFCYAKGWTVKEDVREIGSGLNDARKKLLAILSDGKATKLVVEHKDRLARFGVSYIQECLNKFGCELVIINETDSKREDLLQDFVSVITSFCAKIYGQRRAKRKTEALIRELETSNHEEEV
jgi:predicted site-specific integrase-resolvase